MARKIIREEKISSRTLQVLARTRHCRELIRGGMSRKDAFNEAHILPGTYKRYIRVVARMPRSRLIELPVPVKRKRKKAPK